MNFSCVFEVTVEDGMGAPLAKGSMGPKGGPEAISPGSPSRGFRNLRHGAERHPLYLTEVYSSDTSYQPRNAVSLELTLTI